MTADMIFAGAPQPTQGDPLHFTTPIINFEEGFATLPRTINNRKTGGFVFRVRRELGCYCALEYFFIA
jgi:hypothetical protein